MVFSARRGPEVPPGALDSELPCDGPFKAHSWAPRVLCKSPYRVYKYAWEPINRFAQLLVYLEDI